MHTFYNGLSDSTRTIIDASAGGALMKKTTYQAYEILEDTTTNTNQWLRDRSAPKKPLARAATEVLSNLVNHVIQLTRHVTPQKYPRIFIIKIIIYSGYNWANLGIIFFIFGIFR